MRVRLNVDLHYPTDTEYQARFPNVPWSDELRPFLAELQRAEHIYAMLVLSDLGQTAIEAVAGTLRQVYESLPAGRRPNWNHLKQRCGAYVCVILEQNGFRKTGRKRAIYADHWNRAEVYERVTGD